MSVRPPGLLSALAWLAAGLVLAGYPGRTMADSSFGVFPNMAARQVIKPIQPLAETLGAALGSPTVPYTAPDFRTFVARTQSGAYDLVLTPPHLAWLAVEKAGYQPVLRFRNPVRGLLVVPAAQPPAPLTQSLRDARIAQADSVAMAVLAIEDALATHGLVAGRDFRQIDAGTHTNAVMQVVSGRADAAILGFHPLRALPEDLRRQVRVVLESAPVYGLVLLAHPKYSAEDIAALRTALRRFETTPAGRRFFEQGGYGGLAEFSRADLAAFRRHGETVEARMGRQP